MAQALNKKDQKIMDFLKRQAIDADKVANAKFAAAVAIRGKIISLGFCSKKSHPFAAKYGKNSSSIYLHAETAAILNSLNHVQKEDLEKATMYICRVKRPNANSKNWVHGLAKPCQGCVKAIAEFGFKKVVYSTENDNVYEVWE